MVRNTLDHLSMKIFLSHNYNLALVGGGGGDELMFIQESIANIDNYTYTCTFVVFGGLIGKLSLMTPLMVLKRQHLIFLRYSS